MFKATFVIEEEEPKRIYFSASKGTPKTIEFTAEEKEPVRIRVDSNLKMEVIN